jgi:hypothetical protein
MTSDSADLTHITQYSTTKMPTDISDTKPFSIVYVIRTDTRSYSSLHHLHDKLENAQNCPNLFKLPRVTISALHLLRISGNLRAGKYLRHTESVRWECGSRKYKT